MCVFLFWLLWTFRHCYFTQLGPKYKDTYYCHKPEKQNVLH